MVHNFHFGLICFCSQVWTPSYMHTFETLNTCESRHFLHPFFKHILSPRTTSNIKLFEEVFCVFVISFLSTYRNVPGVLFTMELYCTPKSQHTTVKQSETLRTHVHVQPVRSRNTNSHSCSQEASKLTCLSRSFPTLTQSSNRKESVTKHTHAHLH
jgi:hypothetical protein